MVLSILWNRGSWSDWWLVFGSVEASHIIVDRSLEFDKNEGFLCDCEFIGKGECSSLTRSIIRDIGGLNVLSITRHFGAVNLEKMGIENNLLGAFDDLGQNADSALVGESTSQLDIEDGDVVIDWLDGIWENISIEHGGRSHDGG